MNSLASVFSQTKRTPALFRQALPNFQSPIEANDLAGLSLEEGVLARVVQHTRGETANQDQWRVTHAPLPEDIYDDIGDKDWTLLVQDVDKWDADIGALLDHFNFIPRWRIDDIMVSFAAPGGSVGAHTDQYDVFLLQAEGTRRWLIDESQPHLNPALVPDCPMKLMADFNPTHEYIVEPGDVLYLPPGYAHHGIAETPCLTFSIGMRAPSKADLIEDLAEHLCLQLPEHDRYTDDDLPKVTDPYLIDAHALGRIRSMNPLACALDDAALMRWFGGFITRYRSDFVLPEDLNQPLPEGAKTLDPQAIWHRNPFVRVAWSKLDGGLLFIGGKTIHCPADLAQTLCHSQTLNHEQRQTLPTTVHTFLQQLANWGVFGVVG